MKGLKLKTDPSLFPPTHGGRSAGVGKPRGAFVWDARGKNFCLKRQTSFEVVAGIFSTGLSPGDILENCVLPTVFKEAER